MEGEMVKNSSKKTSHNLTEQCLVCTGPAAIHSHYGAVSCYPCRSFFRRGITRAYVCISGHNKCTVNNITRSNCKKCRFERCLAVGMRSEMVDKTVKRKEREIQLNTEEMTKSVQDLQYEDHQVMDTVPAMSHVEETERDLLAEASRDIQKLNEPLSSQQLHETFYIFDPRNNTFEPIIIARNNEHYDIVDDEQSEDINNYEKSEKSVKSYEMTETIEYEKNLSGQRKQLLQNGNTNETNRVSVIKKLRTNDFGITRKYEETNLFQAKCSNNSIKILDSKMSSIEQDGSIDIEKLVDICFTEKLNTKEPTEASAATHLQAVPETTTQKIRSTSILPFKKRRTKHQFEFLSTAISKDQTPTLGFTFEEEFRLHDLIVRREYIEDEIAKEMLNRGPMIIKTMMERAALEISMNRKLTFDENEFDFTQACSRDLASRMFKDTFDEFKYLDKSVAYNCVHNSFPSSCCLMLAVIEGTKHLGWMEQKKHIGQAGETHEQLEKKYLPNMEQYRGFGSEDLCFLTSPWAQTFDDEQYFMETIKQVGEILGSDLKLSVVYFMLLFSSQPTDSPLVNNAHLKQVQLDLGLLLYRYLTTKVERDEAAEQAHSLIGMLDRLHRCGEIWMNKRIRMLPEDT